MKKLSVKNKSRKQEKSTAKDLGGKTTIASGALVQKGDVISDEFLVECKTTEKPKYTLQLRTWDKIAKEALNSSMRTPVMRIDLMDDVHKQSYAVMGWGAFKLMASDKGFLYSALMEVVGNQHSFPIKQLPVVFTNSPSVLFIQTVTVVNEGESNKDFVVLDWNDFVRMATTE